MQFSTITALMTFILASATGHMANNSQNFVANISLVSVTAKHHTRLHCITASGSGQFIFGFPNDAATNKVCPGFCSDCTLGDDDGHRVCNSAGKQMDGDGFSNACIAAGANGSE
ncbi:hypothetical protein Landi51_05109 [Colletotrichum acutatum]